MCLILFWLVNLDAENVNLKQKLMYSSRKSAMCNTEMLRIINHKLNIALIYYDT